MAQRHKGSADQKLAKLCWNNIRSEKRFELENREHPKVNFNIRIPRKKDRLSEVETVKKKLYSRWWKLMNKIEKG